jgi:hypothetical protein
MVSAYKSNKGKSSRNLLTELKTLNREFWGRYLLVHGYFAANSENGTDEVIMK